METSNFNVVTPKGICRTGHFGEGGSVGVYFQHCEPNSGSKNLEKKVFTVWDEHDENV